MASPEIAAMQMAKVTITTLMMPKVVTAHVGKSICSGLYLKHVMDSIQSFSKAWDVIIFDNLCEQTSSLFAETK